MGSMNPVDHSSADGRLHVLVACHNRRELTLEAARAVSSNVASVGRTMTLRVFDDGSSDGTSAALATEFPQARLLLGDGTAFWVRGMQKLEKDALADASPDDYLVWLNDDVALDPDAFARILQVSGSHPGAIVVGSTRDPTTGAITYGGFESSGWHPLAFRAVPPSNEVRAVATFNGNLVFVPVEVARLLRGIDGRFSHGLADIDYGLRAKRLGIQVLLAPGNYGTCSRNAPDTNGPILKRWKRFIGPKGGGNLRSLWRFMGVHTPAKRIPAIAISYTLWWWRALRGMVIR